jgi:hypothetical protein
VPALRRRLAHRPLRRQRALEQRDGRRPVAEAGLELAMIGKDDRVVRLRLHHPGEQRIGAPQIVGGISAARLAGEQARKLGALRQVGRQHLVGGGVHRPRVAARARDLVGEAGHGVARVHRSCRTSGGGERGVLRGPVLAGGGKAQRDQRGAFLAAEFERPGGLRGWLRLAGGIGKHDDGSGGQDRGQTGPDMTHEIAFLTHERRGFYRHRPSLARGRAMNRP